MRVPTSSPHGQYANQSTRIPRARFHRTRPFTPPMFIIKTFPGISFPRVVAPDSRSDARSQRCCTSSRVLCSLNAHHQGTRSPPFKSAISQFRTSARARVSTRARVRSIVRSGRACIIFVVLGFTSMDVESHRVFKIHDSSSSGILAPSQESSAGLRSPFQFPCHTRAHPCHVRRLCRCHRAILRHGILQHHRRHLTSLPLLAVRRQSQTIPRVAHVRSHRFQKIRT